MAEPFESGDSRTSPAPELNPLLNPTLHKHLDRWAEVYFKSPPEKRDEAVLQLLQELEGQDLSARYDPATPQPLPPPSVESSASLEAPRFGTAVFAPAARQQCQTCGFVARPNQKFCGRCGSRLNAAPVVGLPSFEAPRSQPLPPPRELETRETLPSYLPSEPAPATPERLDRVYVAAPVSEGPDDEPQRWFPYRYFIAAGFMVAVALLAWYAGQSPPSATVERKKAPTPPALTAPDGAPAASAPRDHATTARVETVHPAETGSFPRGQLGMSSAPPAGAQGPYPPAGENQSLTSGVAQPTLPTQLPSGSGAQELAAALEFLDGKGGKEANKAQAAEWLWKSVAKRNTEATVLLGRLYLRGEGVEKNCDQGRILLDAAAKKGSQEASSMLQNLQGFGCQ